MSINSTIINAITPIVPVCVPDMYTGTATEYCTFNYSEIPDNWGDNAPHAIKYLVQLHWFLQSGVNPSVKKKRIKNALLAADFTYPSVVNATDNDGQHFIFETEYCDGEV